MPPPFAPLLPMTLSMTSPVPCRAPLPRALVLDLPTPFLNRPRAEPTPRPLFPHHTEIIERVTRGEQPPFRPSLALQSHLEELGQLMQRCWAEDPQERPPFQQIRLMLRKFNRSLALVLNPPSLLYPPQRPRASHFKSYPCGGRAHAQPPHTQPAPARHSLAAPSVNTVGPGWSHSPLPLIPRSSSGPYSISLQWPQSKWPPTSSLHLSALRGSSHPAL